MRIRQPVQCRRLRGLAAILLPVAIACSAASGDGDTEAGDDAGANCEEQPGLTLVADIQPIFDENCVDECHTDGGNWELFLLDEDTHENLLDDSTEATPAMPYVTPCDPDRSYLVHKLRDSFLEVGGSGVRMPGMETTDNEIVAGDPLPEAQIQLIVDWIEAGAPEG